MSFPDGPIGEAAWAAAQQIRKDMEEIALAQQWEMRAMMDEAKQAAKQATAAAAEATGNAVHGIDFRCVNWFGTKYSFTKGQAAIVTMLWEHWQQGTADVGDDALLEADDPIDPELRERAKVGATKLSQVFRNSPAWGTMIIPGETKGTHRLAEPAKNPVKKPAKKRISRKKQIRP